MSKSKEDLINEVINYFDFEKVHKVMTALDWTYHDTCGEVPMVGDLRVNARKLCNSAYDNNYPRTGSGGFFVSYSEKDNYMKLTFEVTSWEAYDYDEEFPF